MGPRRSCLCLIGTKRSNKTLLHFSEIIEAKFSADDWSIYNTMGQSYPKITITLEDMKRSGKSVRLTSTERSTSVLREVHNARTQVRRLF